jgi:hypothetical protein
VIGHPHEQDNDHGQNDRGNQQLQKSEAFQFPSYRFQDVSHGVGTTGAAI